MSNIINFRDSQDGPGDPPFEDLLDREVHEVLIARVASATATERLTLLTLLENPTAMRAVETLWTEALLIQGSRR